MKVRNLFKLGVITALICSSVHAEMRLLSEKEVSAKGYLPNGKVVSATAKIGSNSGRINSPIPFQSYHEVFLSNPTTHDILYKYGFILCASNKGCVPYASQKTLHPGETYKEGHVLYGVVSYPNPGAKSIYATTEIQGEYADKQTNINTLYVDR